MEITMGRPPIGKVAMTGAERTRLYRRRHGADKPVTKPVTKQASAAADAALAQARAELKQAKARIAELEAAKSPPAHNVTSARNITEEGPPSEALKRRIVEIEQQRDAALADKAILHKRLEDGHRVIAEAKAILAAKAIMPAEVFKTLRDSAHPDRTTDPKLKLRYQKAFQFLMDHERMLAKKPPPPRGADLPRTWEEWEARKWQAKEEARVKRAAKRAAKANPPKSLGRR
jgi:hypothetical protein